MKEGETDRKRKKENQREENRRTDIKRLTGIEKDTQRKRNRSKERMIRTEMKNTYIVNIVNF